MLKAIYYIELFRKISRTKLEQSLNEISTSNKFLHKNKIFDAIY